MEDASLDEFLDGGTEEEPVGGESVDTEGDGGGPEAEDVKSPKSPDDGANTDTETHASSSTMVVSPGGDPCEACGTVVTRCWRADGRLHCVDCKEW